MWNRCGRLEARRSVAGRDRPSHAEPAASRARRAAGVDVSGRPRRARPRAAEHHRPGYRRPADRERRRTVRVVVNGEFYDFERIRGELEATATGSAPDRTARSRCTCSRTAARAALHQLRGEFAFAIWDERDGTLFAARDRFGIKPMYYTIHDGTFYLASEVKALVGSACRCAGIGRRSYESSFGRCTRADRPFDGIISVPPGATC